MSSTMQSQRNEMLERIKTKRREMGYNIHVLTHFFPLTRLKHTAFIGSFAWTSIPIKTKWIIKRSAIKLDELFLTPADVARDYISLKYDKQKRRVTTLQYDSIIKIPRSAPLYAVPCVMDEAVYIDLKSAYWSIVSAFGWDVDYMPNRWVKTRSHCFDFPLPDNKMSRNCLVSVGLARKSNLWTGEKMVQIKASNKLINIMLWAFVQDVLNGVADDIIRLGGVYVHTDGYIVPVELESQAREIINSWGLVSSIKARGYTVVSGVGNYRVGEYETQNYKIRVKPRLFDKVNPVYTDWLRDRVGRWMAVSDRLYKD